MSINDKIVDMFSLHTLQNADSKRKGVILIEIILSLLLILSFTFGIAMLMQQEHSQRYLNILALMWVFSLGFIQAVRKGHVRTSAILYVSFLILMVLGAAWTGGGIRAHGIKILPMLVLFAGLTLGKREIWYFGLAAVAGGFLLAFAEHNGWISAQEPVGNTVWMYWLYSISGILVLCSLENLSIGQLQTALDSLEQQLQLRQASEEKLRIKNETLKQVAYMQSHVLRKPVANLLGIVELVRQQEKGSPLSPELLEHLAASAEELDRVIHHIVEQTEGMDKSDTGTGPI